ncbi:hypothetical protein Tco_1227309 [Tanacetum coccineum]
MGSNSIPLPMDSEKEKGSEKEIEGRLKRVFEDMLKNFDKEDLDKLWSLVKERFNSPGVTDDKEKELRVKLKRLFEPDDTDTLEEANNI